MIVFGQLVHCSQLQYLVGLHRVVPFVTFLMHYLYSSGLRQNSGLSPEAENVLKKYQALLESPLTASNYRERFKFLLQCEEHQMNIDIRNYDMEVWFILVFV